VKGKDEVAQLAISFNKAAARIEALLGSHRRLLANASHELRTPLSRVRLGIEFLRTTTDTERMAALERDIAELDDLIEEILIASRLDTLEVMETIEETDLLAIAAEQCAQYEQCELNGTPVSLYGDERLLRRLIRNLLENASRHGLPPLCVEVCEHDGQACLKVCDHGSGISQAALEAVFEPFYREIGPKRQAGFGLGLALVRQIARRHGGDASIECPQSGGTCVTVLLAKQPPAGYQHIN
jgi:signal transduction histidine kinase